jgi:hypothetical protein
MHLTAARLPRIKFDRVTKTPQDLRRRNPGPRKERIIQARDEELDFHGFGSKTVSS